VLIEKKRIIRLLLILLPVLVAGCTSRSVAPIASRPQPPSDRIAFHEVSRGETLFSIAWRYELDYHKLARANGVLSPYTIYVGQRLSLDLSQLKNVPVSVRDSSRQSSNIKLTPKKQEIRQSVAKKPAPKPPVRARQNTATSVAKKRVAALPKTWQWQWPAKGKVERYYDASKALKGIFIHGGQGSPVKSAAPGAVVYAGSGLRGYGRLIIVKHSEVYLSAYAHNRRILVKEGQVVRAGQKIAEVGGDSENPNRLYFEIRRDGKSINPIGLLP